MRLLFLLFLVLISTITVSAQVLQKIPGLDSRFRETNMSITPNGKYLFFMSQRGGMPWSTLRQAVPGQVAQYDGDIWFSTKQGNSWSAPQCLGTNINTYSGEDEPNITADGQGVYFQSWRDDWEWSGGPYYKAELNGSEWGKPIGMGSNITQFFKDLNLRVDKVFEKDLKDRNLYRDYIKFRTIYPFSWTARLEKKGINFNEYLLGTDGMAISSNEKIFIVSVFNPDKKKYDLFISRKQSNGEWSYPEALQIPNRSNEISVYIAGDNKTIYFASDQAGGMGGYDIYKTTLTSGSTCTTPENLGAPYNSTRDDYGFVVDPTDDKAYQIIDGAIHEMKLLENAKPEETLVINGRVQDQLGNPLEARIQLFDVSDPTTTIANARSNKNTGEYSFSLSKDLGQYQQIAKTAEQLEGSKSFTISSNTANTLEFKIIIEKPDVPTANPIETEEVSTSNPNPPTKAEAAKVVEELKKDDLKTGEILQVDKLYFKADSDDIEADSYEVLDQIAEILNSRPNIAKVEIGGHTNSLPPTEYCEKLSSERAKKIYEYLSTKNVNANRLVYRGYGKRLPIASNDTPEGRKKNQRVEIKILEMK
jgi:outer membrane protein OmpA-like peptidoglycan-associated protein